MKALYGYFILLSFIAPSIIVGPILIYRRLNVKYRNRKWYSLPLIMLCVCTLGSLLAIILLVGYPGEVGFGGLILLPGTIINLILGQIVAFIGLHLERRKRKLDDLFKD